MDSNDGYIKGLYADLFLRISSPTNAAVDGIHFKIHRLLAIKSPLLGALMAETEGDQFLPNASLVLQVVDPNITPEGLGIAIGHLYASYSAAILKNTSLGHPVQRAALLKSVLGSASLLRLPDLAQIATTLIMAEISLANVSLYTAFVAAGQHADAEYGAALAEIRDTLHAFLCTGMLDALPSDPWEDTEGEGYTTLAQVFAGLPFEWLKKIVESRDFDVPSDRER